MSVGFITLRAGGFTNKDQFKRLLMFLEVNKDVCDAVWLGSRGGFPQMSVHDESAALFSKVKKDLYSMNMKYYIDYVNVIGHISVKGCQPLPWQCMVGHDGTVSKGCNCPRNKHALNYISQMTKVYAATRPEILWIDDDLRMNYHAPVEWGCFCDDCVKEFNGILGENNTREQLVEKLNASDEWEYRDKWLQFNAEALGKIAECVIKAVLDVSPDTRIGLQNASFSWVHYSGSFYKNISETVERLTAKKLVFRLGGGFWQDYEPYMMFTKALLMNLDNYLVRDYTDMTVPEIENHPRTSHNKSNRSLLVESSLYLAHGCKGISYAMISTVEDPMYANGFMNEVKKWKPFWKRYVEKNNNTYPAGVGVFYNGKHHCKKLNENEEPFSWAKTAYSDVGMLSTYGLPITFYDKQTVTYLHKDNAASITEDELKSLLSSGVITSGEAMYILTQRGLSGITGIECEVIEECHSEELTNDSINGDYAGLVWSKDVFKGVLQTYYITKFNDRTRVLGEYNGINGNAKSAATIVTQTKYGGRLAVFTLGFEQYIVTTARRYQILSAIDWVSNYKFPVIIDWAFRLVPIPRIDADGRLCSIMLINASSDLLPNTKLKIRNPKSSKINWVDYKDEVELILVNLKEDEYEITTLEMEPWGVAVLEIQ